VLAELLLRRGDQARQFGPYRLIRQIGEGALANVYLAQHKHAQAPGGGEGAQAAVHLRRVDRPLPARGAAASQLGHPNTIAIYDYGTGSGGEFWYAMEYLEGLALSDLVERYGPVPPSRAAWILRQACASLWEAHAHGLVHRDIKPQNIMLCDIVRRARRGQGARLRPGQADVRRADARPHQHLRILGTPLYMSPERIRQPGDADARADIYALGAVGYLPAHRPAPVRDRNRARPDSTSAACRAAARLGACAPFPVPVELDALIGRCLEKDADKRPQSMAEMASALDAVLVYQPWRRDQIEAWWRDDALPRPAPAEQPPDLRAFGAGGQKNSEPLLAVEGGFAMTANAALLWVYRSGAFSGSGTQAP
jgi:serine/threonine protein kinase